MTDPTNSRPSPVNGPANAVSSASVERHGLWHNAWQVFKTIQARLRFVAILVAIGLVIGNWGWLTAYWDRWTRPTDGEPAAAADVEYFCPMHPYIVRDTPREKCPICHMDLARRKKGSVSPEPLAPGTVSRVQLSPYRIVLAGIRTSNLQYRALTRDIVTVGTVEFDETKYRRVAARQKGRIVKQFVNYTGQMVHSGEDLAVVDVRYSPELTATLEDLLKARQAGDRPTEEMARKRLRLWDLSDDQVSEFLKAGRVNTRLTITSPIQGHVTRKYQREGDYVDEGQPLYEVADLSTVWVEGQVYEADQGLLRTGQAVEATTAALPGREPFRGQVSFVYPHLDEATRTLAVRFEVPNPDHQLRPGMYATVRVEVPAADVETLTTALAYGLARDTARTVFAGAIARPAILDPAAALGTAFFAAAKEAVVHQGLALAIPDSAVIDTGAQKVVYRQTSPDIFEGVAVRLGPRMTAPGNKAAFYPVIEGLAVGDQVVTNGAFLIDADTRLNPAAGSIYFGGSASDKAGQAQPALRPSTPADVGESDRRLIAEQRSCPITGKPLGSMGAPVKVRLPNDQAVFLCCDGCVEEAKSQPDRTLAAVRKRKAVDADKDRR
jgi:Cu(I)/Ag(I) efflux system membrane fusion protein